MTPTYPLVPARPSVPLPFAAGTLKVPAGAPVALLDLIHAQINRDVPGTSTQLKIQSDPCNVAPVYFGCYMGNPLQASASEPANASRPGPLSAQNYGFFLTPMGEPIDFRSSFPGTQSPIGVLQVFSEAPAKIHVTVVE